MNTNVLHSISLEELNRIVCNDSYDTPPLRSMLDKHTAPYVRVRERFSAELGLHALLELYLYACETDDPERSAQDLVEHSCYFYSGATRTALEYGETYTPRPVKNRCRIPRTSSPRESFRRNFRIFFETGPSVEAHLARLDATVALCRNIEATLIEQLVVPQCSQQAPAVEPEANTILRKDDYFRMVSTPLRLRDQLPAFPEAKEKDTNNIVQLYTLASEVRLQDADDYPPAIVYDILKDFCFVASYRFSGRLSSIIAFPEDEEAVGEACMAIIQHLLANADEPAESLHLSADCSLCFADAARKALRYYCWLVAAKECYVLWPLLLWQVRLNRLQLEWKAEELEQRWCKE